MKPMTNTPAGSITAKGYWRIWHDGRARMEHVVVWEREHGEPVPPGHDVHHVDRDKLNNDPSNLQLVTKLEHKRIHSGCELRDGEWWKPCRVCGEMKPITAEHWYMVNGSPSYGKCRGCRITEVVEAKRSRRRAVVANLAASRDL